MSAFNVILIKPRGVAVAGGVGRKRESRRKGKKKVGRGNRSVRSPQI